MPPMLPRSGPSDAAARKFAKKFRAADAGPMAARRGLRFYQILTVNFRAHLGMVCSPSALPKIEALGKIPKTMSDGQLLGSIYE